MPDNHIIPVSSGLFEHRERIGPALWEFLWCIDAVTSEEIDAQGNHWGLVHGGAIVKYERIAQEAMTSERTVKRNMALLMDEGYIETVRTARGYIIKLAKNKKDLFKKRSANNGTSQESDIQKVAHHNESEVPIMAHHEANLTKSGTSLHSDVPYVAPLKDFKDLSTTSTTTTEFSESDENEEDPYLQLLNAYCKLNNRFDIHVKRNERDAMGKMVAGGMPNPFTIRTMESLLEAKRAREGNAFKLPTSFLYYENALWEAWRNENSITAAGSTDGVILGTRKNSKSQQEQDLEELRIAKEEAKRLANVGSD
ncbi:hypothetical protein [Paenibacillus periandrae]|uniref:hypothetical protein n=1 Tax=Paenibacillus periandrae TaxID=1761741 RepID=UPI001F0931FB|nr:hypothetical protein [Paenibacillus periandrae]